MVDCGPKLDLQALSPQLYAELVEDGRRNILLLNWLLWNGEETRQQIAWRIIMDAPYAKVPSLSEKFKLTTLHPLVRDLLGIDS